VTATRSAHRLLRAVLGLLLLGSAASALPAQGVLHGDRRHVHGVVEDSATGRPVAGAEVLLTDAAGTTVARLRSDDRGRFDVRDLPPAVLQLRIRIPGYAPHTEPVDLRTADRLLTVHLALATTALAAVDVRTDAAPASDRTTATSTLDAATLARVRGQTLGDAIRNLPGVAVIQFGPSIAKPVIRGLNSQRVLVTNGGVRQEDQQWGTEHAPNIDSFEANSITVVRGAATVLYGADALGGVVRVEPAPVPESGGAHGTVALNTFANSRQGAVSAMVQGADLALPGIGRTGYRLRVTTRMAGNSAAPDYALANTGFRERNGSLALGAAHRGGHSIVTLSHFATELGVLRQAHVGNADDLARAMTAPPTDSAFSYTIGRPSQRVAHTTLRARTELALPRGQSLEVVYALQYNHRREYDNHGPLRFRDEPAFNLKLYTNTLDARLTHARWKGLQGTVGSSAVVQGNQTLGKAFLIPGFDLFQGAVYAQEELAVGRLSLLGGARADVIRQTTIAYADLGIRSPAGTRRWQNVSGSLGAAYLIADGFDASVRVARAWRPPTVNERYAQGVHHGTAQYELGSATLREEVSLGAEATLRYRGARGQVDLAAYRNQIDGFIYLRPTEPVFTIRGTFPGYRYTQTDARLSGLELASEWPVVRGVSLTLNGTAVRGTDRRTGAPLFDMPADRATVGVQREGAHAQWGQWRVGTNVQFVRRQHRVPTGTVYALPTAGYTLAGLDIGSDGWRLFGHPVDASLSVTNALDARYRDYLSRYRLFVDDAGRDIVARLSVPF